MRFIAPYGAENVLFLFIMGVYGVEGKKFFRFDGTVSPPTNCGDREEGGKRQEETALGR